MCPRTPDMTPPASLVDCIGNTPLVPLRRVAHSVPGQLLAKVEYVNPGQSVKDRIAAYMLNEAEARGEARPGSLIIEPTSGNTGIGLALVARIKGYRCLFTISDKQSQEKIDMMRHWGTEVIVCPSQVAHDHPDSYWSTAARLAKEKKDAIFLNQYHNPDNLACHYATTGPEIWRDTGGAITHYLAGLGTGGTLCGAGRFLKEKKSSIKTVGVDPEGSILRKYVERGHYRDEDIRDYAVEGIGSDFIPKNVKREYIDATLTVNDKEAALMTRKLHREEGLFVGWSSGAAVAGALRYAGEHLKAGDVMVVVLPDHGSRYLNKIYNDRWMEKMGYFTDGTGEPKRR